MPHSKQKKGRRQQNMPCSYRTKEEMVQVKRKDKMQYMREKMSER